MGFITGVYLHFTWHWLILTWIIILSIHWLANFCDDLSLVPLISFLQENHICFLWQSIPKIPNRRTCTLPESLWFFLFKSRWNSWRPEAQAHLKHSLLDAIHTEHTAGFSADDSWVTQNCFWGCSHCKMQRMGDYFDSAIFLAEWQPFYTVLKYTSQNWRLYIHCQRMLPYQLLLRYQDCFCSILRISSLLTLEILSLTMKEHFLMDIPLYS